MVYFRAEYPRTLPRVPCSGGAVCWLSPESSTAGPVVTGVMLHMRSAPTSVDRTVPPAFPVKLEIYGSEP
jgi:hypothetical protein